mgnify:CR=1 FL=1
MKSIVFSLLLVLLFFFIFSCNRKNTVTNISEKTPGMVEINDVKQETETKIKEIEKKKILLEGKIISKEKYLEIKKYYNPLLEGKKIDDEWLKKVNTTMNLISSNSNDFRSVSEVVSSAKKERDYLYG